MTAQHVSPIRKANRQAIRDHLQMLFRRADAIQPGSVVAIMNSNAALTALNETRTFPATPAGLDQAAEHAARMNEQGKNVYVGAAARRPGTVGRGTNKDILFTTFHWAEVDDADGELGLELWGGATPSATIVTGTEPTKRTHVYWELEAPTFDMAQWKARQKVLAAAICGDPAVVDESRVLRIAGTFSYPKADKVARGYRVEMVGAADQTGCVTTPEQLMKGLSHTTPVSETVSDGARPIGDPSLLARDQDELLRVIAETPNELDYADWVAATHAIKAACGGSPEGFEAYVEWCLKYPSMTAEAAEAKWDSVTESRIGADHVYNVAARAGVGVSSAANDFEPLEPDEEPYVAPEAKPAKRFAPLPKSIPDNFNPKDIELRKWVLGNRFLVGSVTGGVGAPGVGKSTFSILTGIAIATGRELTGEKVYISGPVWLHNHEDDEDEMLRRIAGVCLHHGIPFDELRRNFFFSSGAVQRLVVAVKEGDIVKHTNAVLEIIRTIKDMGVVYMAVDPLVSTHDGINENSNSEMEKVVNAFRTIARETGCAIDLVHHTVKNHDGDTESRAGDMNAARGAGAFIGAARISYTLSPMSIKGAQDRGLPLELASNLVRLDNAKGNYAGRKLGQPVWYEMKSVSLGNGDDDLDDLLCDGGQESDTVAVHVVYDLNAQIAESAAEEAEREAVRAISYLGDIVSEFPKGIKRMSQGDLADRLLKRWDLKRTMVQERIKATVPDGTDKATVVELGGTRYLVYRTSAGDHASAAKYVHCVEVA